MALLFGLAPHEVPVFETFVVPRYLSSLGAMALEMTIPSEGAVVASIGCRTGFPDQLLPAYLPAVTVLGFDPSEAALELARTKGALVREAAFAYHLAKEIPLPLPDGSCSHAMSIHTLINPDDRVELLREMSRILVAGGQALLALPLRGSYQEIADLLREYALKHDATEVAKALEANTTSRPTVETLTEMMEDVGLQDVDVDMRPITLAFKSGRDAFEDPVMRMLILPEIERSLGLTDLSTAFRYVRDAIDRYWSEGDFELSINLGCASGRRF